ncbi:MAG: hypothetical protein RL662_359 [Bacteroidota bacterium]|jgi:tRNA A37 threonylcarbamoyladenosine dehydratase
MVAEIFGRTELLLGIEGMQKIASKKVILFGVGGVGSWCAEGLIRAGIHYLTVVDSDRVAASNINRQLPATTQTVGLVKVEVLKERLLEINPQATINAVQEVYSIETSDSFHLHEYDYVIDAIDSLTNKMDLLFTACNTKATVFSSMGAALKMDSTKIKVAEFWKVIGCPLAAALRRKFKKNQKPRKKIYCVYSDELLDNKGFFEGEAPAARVNKLGEPDTVMYDARSKKVQINGTVSHVTAIFGFTLSGLVINDICKS